MKCQHCGSPTKFINKKLGYRKYCSYTCSSRATLEKRKQTCLKKYGTENPMQSPSIKLKCPSPFKNKDIQLKAKQSIIKKYGVDCPLKSEICKNNFKKTCLKNMVLITRLNQIKLKIKLKKQC